MHRGFGSHDILNTKVLCLKTLCVCEPRVLRAALINSRG